MESESNYRSRYGIEKLQDHNYHTWSFQCQMLLSEKKIWSAVTRDTPQRLDDFLSSLTSEQLASVTDKQKKEMQKDYNSWSEKNEEALRVISFTVSDRLQAAIIYGRTAKGAWDELQKVHTPKDKQRKYSLLKRLYRLDVSAGSSLLDHELVFDTLV